MSHTNKITKAMWLVTSAKHHFVIAASSKKDCKELIDELAEETVTEKLIYMEIGNIRPTLPFYDNWQGESFIITSKF